MIVLIETLASLALFISAFGQLQRIEIGSANFYIFEIPLILSLAGLLWQYKLLPFTSVKLHELSSSLKWFLYSLLGTLIISFIYFSLQDNVIAVMYFARIVTYTLFILFCIFHAIKQNNISTILKVSVGIYIGATIISGLLQYFYYPDLGNLFYEGWDPHYFRLFGTFLEPVIAASVYGLIEIFIVFERRVPKYLRIILVIILTGMMVMTYSRAVLLALLITAIIFAARSKALKLVLGGLVIALLIFVLLPKPSGEGVNMLRTSTIFSRAVDYEEGFTIWRKNPLFGIGYNHLGAVKVTPKSLYDIPNHSASSLHSSFLIILATGGILSFCFFLNWLLQLAGVSAFLKYGVLFISVCAFFDNVLLHPFVLLLIGVLGSLSANRLSRTSV